MLAALPKSFLVTGFTIRQGWIGKSVYFFGEKMVEFTGKKMKLLLFLALWVFAAFSNFNRSYAEQLTIQPGAGDGKDSYISQRGYEEDKNFGNSEGIYVGYDDCERSLIQFDLVLIPPNASISYAELYLYLMGSYDDQETEIYVHRITNFWKEQEVTWKERYREKRWNSQGGDFDWTVESSVSLMGKSSGWVSWDVTKTVKGWFNREYINFGFLLSQDINNRNENRFLSSDTPWEDYRPKLVISYKLIETPAEPVPSVRVYPNPFKPTAGHSEVKFINLPLGASVKIFSIGGAIIATLQEKDEKANWDVRDNEGKKVSSGFYLYLIETERERQYGKIVILR